MKSLVLSTSILVLLSGCSQGRKQYQSPSDQRVDQKAGPADIKVPSSATNPAASLVEGWYVDPTPEVVAAKISEAVRSPILPGVGLAGITTEMSRTEIEAKIGQPDFVTSDAIAVYGNGAIYVFYDDSTKSKVEALRANPGYLGALSSFEELKIGTDLATAFAAVGGRENFIKKLYQSLQPAVSDCLAAKLCTITVFPTSTILSLTNQVVIGYEDEPGKASKKIYTLLTEAREPDAGAFADTSKGWAIDLLDGSLKSGSGETIVSGKSTWAEVRELGQLQDRVEARDFRRTLNRFGLGLKNSLSMDFERTDYKNSSEQAPTDSARVTSLAVGQEFEGKIQLGTQVLQMQLCQVTSPIPQSPASVLTLKTKALSADATGNASSQTSFWTLKVAAADAEAATSDSFCVSLPMQADVGQSMKKLVELAFQNITEKLSTPAKKLDVEVAGDVKFKGEFSPENKEGQRLSAADFTISFALSKLVFQQSFLAASTAAQELFGENSVLVLANYGDASLEDKQSIQSSFTIYQDESREEGLQVSVVYYESTGNLLFVAAKSNKDLRNVDASLSVVKDQNVNLDETLSFGTKQFTAGASVAELNLFDRSQRYAELDGEDPVTYSERLSVSVGTELETKSHIFDIVVAWQGVLLFGARQEDGVSPETTMDIQGIQATGFPQSVSFSLSCGGELRTLNMRETFSTAYDKLKRCGLFLTPGYGTQNVPAELHVAPELGKRKHGLTLKFVDGLLDGFMVYDTNSLKQ